MGERDQRVEADLGQVGAGAVQLFVCRLRRARQRRRTCQVCSAPNQRPTNLAFALASCPFPTFSPMPYSPALSSALTTLPRTSTAQFASRCPKALPKFRIGLDAGTHAGSANAVRDGEALQGWRDGGGCDGPNRDSPAVCATVHASLGGATNLTLWLRVLSGSAVVHVEAPTAALYPVHGDDGSARGLQVRLASRDATLLLSGEVSGPSGSGFEPQATGVAFQHRCQAPGAYAVRATLLVKEHVPVPLMWRVLCAAS